MKMTTKEPCFELADKADLPTLERIRKSAFQPIFQSFRKILGDNIYNAAQKPEDAAQGALLASYLEAESAWTIWKALLDSRIVGFMALSIDQETKVGEIGLNAIDPGYARQGLGTKMYRFALTEMKEAGMQVATVATGGDPSHLPARIAYQKAGFTVQIPSVWMCQELV